MNELHMNVHNTSNGIINKWNDILFKKLVLNNIKYINWYYLSKNDNVINKYILNKHFENEKINSKWNIESLSENKNVDINFTLKYPNYKWNYVKILYNNPLNFDEFEKLSVDLKDGLIKKINLIINKLIKMENLNKKNTEEFSIPLKFIEKYKNTIKFNYGKYGLSMYKNITLDYINKNDNKFWVYGDFGISCNPNFTSQYYIDNLSKKWSFGKDGLSRNNSIKLTFILFTLHQDWNWEMLSSNNVITPEIVDVINDNKIDEFIKLLNTNYQDYNIMKKYSDMLSKNGSLKKTIFKIKKVNYGYGINKKLNWGKNGLSNNDSINEDFINRNLDKNWDWDELSSHQSITMKFIRYHNDKDWNYYKLYKNKNIELHTKYNEHENYIYNKFINTINTNNKQKKKKSYDDILTIELNINSIDDIKIIDNNDELDDIIINNDNDNNGDSKYCKNIDLIENYFEKLCKLSFEKAKQNFINYESYKNTIVDSDSNSSIDSSSSNHNLNDINWIFDY